MLKKYAINYSLITEFRDAINSNNDYIFFKYYNKKGKNQWHIICSCMDWISVSVNFMHSLPEPSKNIDEKSMQVYSLITSVDNVFEAIKQLHRIFHEDEELKIWPFKKNSQVFKEKSIDCCDEKYFKEIRAFFGAHPTNLKKQKGNDSKFFASWPVLPMFSDGDLSVNLYSLTPGDEDIKVTIKIREIIAFFNERYQYLSCLINKANELYIDFCMTQSKNKIPETDSINSELKVLENESKHRLNNNYYKFMIEELKKIFSVNLNEEKLTPKELAFKKECGVLIGEIRNNLQKMDLVDLKHGDIISSRLNNSQYNYYIGKIFESLSSETINSAYETHLNYVNEISNYEYNFSRDDDTNITFLKLKMMIFFKNKD